MSKSRLPAFKAQFKSAFSPAEDQAAGSAEPTGRRIAEAIVGAQGETARKSAAPVPAPAAPKQDDSLQNALAELSQQITRNSRETWDTETERSSSSDRSDITEPSSDTGAAEAEAQQTVSVERSSDAGVQYMLTDSFAESGGVALPETPEPGSTTFDPGQEVSTPAPAPKANRSASADIGDDANQAPSPVAQMAMPIGQQKVQLSAWSDQGKSASSSERAPEENPKDAPEQAAAVLEEPEDRNITVDPIPSMPVSPTIGRALPESAAKTSAQAAEAAPEGAEARTVSEGQTANIDGGRVTTFDVSGDKDIAAIHISDMPEHGHASVNLDQSLAVVMTGSDYTGPLSLDYVVTYADGTSETKTLEMRVSAPQQERGWGNGEHYMLAEDASGDLIVETGENHRKVYVTGSDQGLTRADIAEREGLDVSQISDQWLYENPQYGGSEDLALAEDVASGLWQRMSLRDGDTPVSHWVLFERGHEYDEFKVNLRGINGESELHPVHFTAWGEGERPIMNEEAIALTKVQANFVISDLSFHGGLRLSDGENVILHNVEVTDDTIAVQNMANVTFHDSQIHNITRDAPVHDEWNAFADRESGLFVSNTNGLYIDGSMFHHNAWAADYQEKDGGQPPSLFSHNIYIQNTTFDVTFTDNIVSQGASYGAQFRGGVWAQNNAFVDNNAGVSFLGGDYKEAGPIGNFTYFADNVITSAGHKAATQIGALAWGVLDGANQSTMLDNIIAHLSDPNNGAEIDAKYSKGSAMQSSDTTHYDDTVIYRWHPSSQSYLQDELNENVDGLSQSELDMITIQRFASIVLGDANASIGDLMDYILSLPEDQFGEVSAEDIVAYFQNGFGITDQPDTAGPETHRFVPNDLGEGTRWQSNINWHDDEVPEDGDSVMLGGNSVHFGGTSTIDSMDFGQYGALEVAYGKLTVTGFVTTGTGAASLEVNGAGQIWMNGLDSSGRLAIEVTSGRFANTGSVEGDTVLTATDGQVLLGVDDASFDLTDDSELRLVGSELRAGFDGETGGTSVVKMEDNATMTFVADENGLASIQEFRSGALGDDPDVQSGISLDGTLQIDLGEWAKQTGTHALIEVDALHGVFSDINIHGLDSKKNALVTVDYDIDAVLIQLSAGNGAVSVDTIGSSDDGSDEDDELWAALTDGQGDLDAGGPDISALSGPLADPDQNWL